MHGEYQVVLISLAIHDPGSGAFWRPSIMRDVHGIPYVVLLHQFQIPVGSMSDVVTAL